VSSVINTADARKAKEADATDVAATTTQRRMYISRKRADFTSIDDDDDVDTAMSFTLAHELTCITTTLQRKKLIS
jgi:hypothetical protein